MGLVSALYELQIISYPSISKFFNKVLDNANGSSFFYIANGSSHKKKFIEDCCLDPDKLPKNLHP